MFKIQHHMETVTDEHGMALVFETVTEAEQYAIHELALAASEFKILKTW